PTPAIASIAPRHPSPSPAISSVPTISGAQAPPARPDSDPTNPCTVVRTDSGNQLRVTLLRLGYAAACASPKLSRTGVNAAARAHAGRAPVSRQPRGAGVAPAGGR